MLHNVTGFVFFFNIYIDNIFLVISLGISAKKLRILKLFFFTFFDKTHPDRIDPCQLIRN
jgi:hypothetical protein